MRSSYSVRRLSARFDDEGQDDQFPDFLSFYHSGQAAPAARTPAGATSAQAIASPAGAPATGEHVDRHDNSATDAAPQARSENCAASDLIVDNQRVSVRDGASRDADADVSAISATESSTQDAVSSASAARPHAANDAIVKLKGNVDLVGYADLLKASGVESVEVLDDSGIELWHLSTSFEQSYSMVGMRSEFEFFQPDYEIEITDVSWNEDEIGVDLSVASVPNDPLYLQTYGIQKINAPSAWNITTGGAVKVAVLDTGVDYNHPDLVANIWTNPGEIAGNNIDDDKNGFRDDVHGWDFVQNDNNPMDDNSHGTHVAGIIAADGNNGIGISGVAWDAQIVPIKTHAANKSGSTSDAVKAISYAKQIGVKIINASWGGYQNDAALSSAISSATNILFVAAAGNDGNNNDSRPFYPSSLSAANVISVAASDSGDAKPFFSNFGRTSVDLAAPGYAIISTVPGESYNYMSGTSMAAPFVSGVAALMWAVNPSLTVAQVKSAILSTADPVAAFNGIVVTGGRLDAFGAVSAVAPQAGSVSISDLSISEGHGGTKVATFTVTRSGGTAAFSVSFATSDGTARVSDGDYVAAAGTLQFAANENSRTISVTINGDTRVESDETFFVNLSAPSGGATLGDSQAVGTISNDDIATNHAPTLTAFNVATASGQVLAAASLFNATDPDGDALSYWFRDNTPGGGHFEFDGVAKPDGQTFGVTQAQLSHVTYRAAPGGTDSISINAWDGQASSSVVTVNVSAPGNHAPTLTASNISAAKGQVLAASSLFSANDPDGDALSYWFRDNTAGGGHFEFDGIAKPDGQTFGVSLSQLSHVTYRASTGAADNISINVWDGQASSPVASINVTPVGNTAPTLTASSISAAKGQVISASSLFSAGDADGDALSYWFRDNTAGGGRFEYDGTPQAEGQTFGVSQSQLSHLTFRAGNSGADNISLNVWDGQASSSVLNFNVSVAANHAPTLTASNIQLLKGMIFPAAGLFNANDSDGDVLSYWFRDNTIGGGRFEYDGVPQAEGQTFGVSQSQLSHLTFHAATSGSDSITVNAWDGQASSALVTFQLFV